MDALGLGVGHFLRIHLLIFAAMVVGQIQTDTYSPGGSLSAPKGNGGPTVATCQTLWKNVSYHGLCDSTSSGTLVEVLSCTGSGIMDVYPDVPVEPQVRILDLSDNRLQGKGLGAFLRRFPNMTHLILDRNHIYSLETLDIDQVHYLEVLTLRSNGLDYLERRTFSWAPRLRRLSLSRNRLEILHRYAFLGLGRLCSLDLSDNSIYEVDRAWFTDLDQLRRLDLSDNGIISLVEGQFRGLASLQELLLRNNRITHVSDDAFTSTPPQFVHLDLSENKLSNVPSVAFAKLRAVHTLVFDRNPVTALETHSFSGFPVSVISLTDMKSLRIVDPEAVYNLSRLHTLRMAGNQHLRYVSRNAFVQLPSLKFLFLDSNSLLTLEEAVLDGLLPNLPTLTLGGNPLMCDCSVRWLLEFLQGPSQNTTLSITDIGDLKCSDPPSLWDRPLLNVSTQDLENGTCVPRILPLFRLQVSTILEESLRFDCRATGTPLPVITWTLPGNHTYPVDSGIETGRRMRYRIDKFGSLFIFKVDATDSGIYTCTATNSLGVATRVVQLSVKNANAAILILQTTHKAITVTWHLQRHLHSYYVLYRRADANDTFQTILINSFMRSYTIGELRSGTVYDICISVEHNGDLLQINCTVVRTRPSPEPHTRDPNQRYYVIGALVGALLFLILSVWGSAYIYKVHDAHKQKKREIYLDNSNSTFLPNSTGSASVTFENPLASALESFDLTPDIESSVSGMDTEEETTSLAK